MLKWGLFNLIGQLLRITTTLICIPILINYMGIELYGLWSWAITVLAVVQLAEGGLSSGFLYFLSKNEESEIIPNTLLTSCLILLGASTVIIYFGIYLSVPYLINSIDNLSLDQQTDMDLVMKAGAFLIIIRIVQSLFWAILQAEQRYELYAVVSTCQVVFTNIAWIILAYNFSKQLPIYMFASILISFCTILILFKLTSNSFKKFKWEPDLAMLKKLFNYNSGVWGGSIGSAVFSQGDRLIVANVLGPATLSVYVVFSSICVQLNQLASQIVHPIFPIVSSAYKEAIINKSKIRISISRIFLINVYLSLVGSITLIVFSEQILIFFLKNNFQKKYILYFCIMAGTYGIYTLSVTGYYILLGKGKSTKVMRITVVSSVFVLVSIYFLSHIFGLFGAVLGNMFFLFILKLLVDAMQGIYQDCKSWMIYLLNPSLILSLLLITIYCFNFSLPVKYIFFLIVLIVLLLIFIRTYNNITNS